MKYLAEFAQESNRIEGIKSASVEEILAYETLLGSNLLSIDQVFQFVKVCQPNAILRGSPYIPGVQVGSHIAPPSGPDIITNFQDILDAANDGKKTPWEVHVCYERLHPFTDGNGRSGRAIWLYHMKRNNRLLEALKLGFLHAFYYQTLAQSQE